MNRKIDPAVKLSGDLLWAAMLVTAALGLVSGLAVLRDHPPEGFRVTPSYVVMMISAVSILLMGWRYDAIRAWIVRRLESRAGRSVTRRLR